MLVVAIARGFVLTAIVSALGALVLAVFGLRSATAQADPNGRAEKPRSDSFLRRQWEMPYRTAFLAAIALTAALIVLDLTERDFTNLWWHGILGGFAVILLYLRQRRQ